MSDEPGDRTRPLDSGLPARPRCSLLDDGSEIVLTRIRPKCPGDELQPVVGVLLGRPVAGGGLRIRVGARKVFVTSPIRSLASLGHASLQVCTTNSVYRLDLRTVEPEAQPSPPVVDATAHGRSEHPGHAEEGEATQFVSAPVPVPASGDPFGSGACVHVTWVRGREREECGPGQILDPLEVGEELRLALDRGPTLATTAIRMLRYVAPDTIEIETKNTTYYLRLVAEAKPDPPSC